jgi:hypothetical protein
VAFVPLFAALERRARSGGWRGFGLGLAFLRREVGAAA